MTVSTTIIKNSHSGNGTLHSFAYGFKIFADGDLDVIVRSSTGSETVKTLNTDYIVTNAGNDSGGNVLFKFNTGTSSDAHFSSSDKRPQSGETIVLRRGLDITQSTDYVANDPFPAESHESALDRLTFISQEIQEELDRSLKISRTNTMTSTEFTTSSTDRANKVLSFNGSGELAVTQELGTFKGNWAASTAYLVRDIVKDTSTNNIFIVTEAHTSSGSQPLTTNANSAKYSLIVDAASATTSQTAAATSATAAANSATAAGNSETAAGNSETAAGNSQTAAANSATASANSATAAANAQAAAEAALDTFDDRFLGAKSSDPSVDNDGNALIDGALYFDTANDIMKVYDLTNTQWRQLTLTSSNQTNVNTVAAAISNVNTVAGNNSNITSVAGNSSNINSAVSNASNINTVAGAVTNVNTVASNITGVNSFAERYRVGSSNPGSNNDAGDLFFNTTTNELVAFNGSAFQSTSPSAANQTNINIVAGEITSTEDLGSITESIDTSSGNNIDTVANNITNVNTVGGISSNVSTVAGISSNVTTVAGIASNVTTVASNISSINNFEDRYRVASSAPTSSLDAGDLYFNTSTQTLNYYDGSQFVAVVAGAMTSLAVDSTPQLGGDLDVNGNDIVSASNGHITIDPNGSGLIKLVGTVDTTNLTIDFGSIA